MHLPLINNHLYLNRNIVNCFGTTKTKIWARHTDFHVRVRLPLTTKAKTMSDTNHYVNMNLLSNNW
ncbi:hypothetical protein HanPSC8_Chr01g0023071 [Helianthus annuus]|nr:hypothetical protein HanPSC8_Chr01g0023071 [Helianthus annuus]